MTSIRVFKTPGGLLLRLISLNAYAHENLYQQKKELLRGRKKPILKLIYKLQWLTQARPRRCSKVDVTISTLILDFKFIYVHYISIKINKFTVIYRKNISWAIKYDRHLCRSLQFLCKPLILNVQINLIWLHRLSKHKNKSWIPFK